MCRSVLYTSPNCKCQWMAIVCPCYPGYGFSTCPHFFNGFAKHEPKSIKATRSPCPVHELFGCYDRNQIRMVVEIKKGIRWGTGPNKGDFGVEFNCCSVM